MKVLTRAGNGGWRRGRDSSIPAQIMVSLICLTLILSGVPGVARAEVTVPPGLLSLKDVPVREDPKLYTDYVKDKAAAIAFGKALFWDMQYGSDAVQACASCHYHGGIDPRTKGQLNPGSNANDSQFGNPADVIEKVMNVDGNPRFAPNYEVTADDFPFHSRKPETAPVLRSDPNSIRPPDPLVQFANVERDVNDVISSQGVRSAKFLGVLPKVALDLGLPLKDPVFTLKKVNIRRVEPRNTPTMINAVFNADNFWDGRASNVFNGVNPFGFRDQTSTLLKNINGTLSPVQVRIFFSSLASQAVGPPVSDFEMAYQGRDFPRIGRKMLSLKPLAKQLVHPHGQRPGQHVKRQA